jgi:hypothetical protein
MRGPRIWARCGIFAGCWLGTWLVAEAGNASGQLPHLELDLSGAEYQALIEQAQENGTLGVLEGDPLSGILAVGKRNLEWIEFINLKRAAGAKLELSTAATQVGIPITAPREANRKITLDNHSDVMSALPDFMKEVLLQGKSFHDQIPISDADFLVQLRAVDMSYQRASRWLLQEPYLFQYSSRMAGDVRGFYFLQREPDLDAKLRDFANLPPAKQTEISQWIVGQCRNAGGSESGCAKEVKSKGAAATYTKYLSAAKRHFDSFFSIQNPRPEVKWTGDGLTQPFSTPKDPEVRDWLKFNVEDEWKWGKFQLVIDFQKGFSNPEIVFEPGATPNVNGLGGGRITMDANRSLQEYTTRWTIRHEYGHVLGFPDCYLEFYDQARGVMINYQIDLDNLMCSRRGRLQEGHLDQLRKHYR